MARRHMNVYINNCWVRTFGGNGFDVACYHDYYLNVTKEQFLERHPRWKEEVEKNGFHLEAICPCWSTQTETMNKHWEKEN